jgi:cellulose synthase (UDP-forming)
VQEVEDQMTQSVARLQKELNSNKANPILEKAALVRLKAKLREVGQALRRGDSLSSISDTVRRSVQEAQESVAEQDYEQIAADLADLATLGDSSAKEAHRFILDRKPDLVTQTAPSAGDVLGVSKASLAGIELTRPDEAIPVLALSTISITEDTATAMRLHSMGWTSIFHGEILAYGLAPEDLGTALSQRLRWAQGTLQIMMRENPLFHKGLTLPQRLLYFNMGYSYFGGFVNLIFLSVPILYLFTQLSAVSSWSLEFIIRLLPLLILKRILYAYVTRGLNVRRSEEYSLALFPLWIQAVVSVFSGMELKFTVTAKQRQSGNYFRLVLPQVVVVLLTIAASIFGVISLLQ